MGSLVRSCSFLNALFLGCPGLESLLTSLDEVSDRLMKMDLQNVLYRYFAESARFFKKIQHCVGSGEAELLVVRDGEEPRADDLKAASQEFLDQVEAFCTWRANERGAVEKKLQKVMQLRRKLFHSTCKLCAVLLFGGLVGYFVSWASRLPALWILAVTAGGAVITALLGHFLGNKCETRKLRGLIGLWQKMGALESTLCGFLQSLPLAFHSRSYTEALASTQSTRFQLDCFLQQLQMKGLIFDPAAASFETSRSGP